MLTSTTIVKKYIVGCFEICETFKRGKETETEMKYTVFYKCTMVMCDISMEELANLKELIDEVL